MTPETRPPRCLFHVFLVLSGIGMYTVIGWTLTLLRWCFG